MQESKQEITKSSPFWKLVANSPSASIHLNIQYLFHLTLNIGKKVLLLYAGNKGPYWPVLKSNQGLHYPQTQSVNTLVMKCMVNVQKFQTLYAIAFLPELCFYAFIPQNIWWKGKQCRSWSDCSFSALFASAMLSDKLLFEILRHLR